MSSCAYQLKLVNSIRASLDVQVAERLDYRNSLLAGLIVQDFTPFTNQLQDYCPTRALRSGDQNLLSVKKTRIKIGEFFYGSSISPLERATISNKES